MKMKVKNVGENYLLKYFLLSVLDCWSTCAK